ncbi:MAG: hypothetical protein U1D67_03335, partial [Dehalococcoidia bacterium]|nr:hypothetical protein [Dehalococcoidia bacterium]
MSVYNYPAPCAPDYKKPTKVADCLPQARKLVTKIAASEQPKVGVAPRLFVKEGDVVLIVTLPDQDKYVAEAAAQALMEKGAKKVDFIYPRQLVGRDPEIVSVEDGWKEVELLKAGKASGTEADLITGLGLGEAARKHLDEHPEYTSIFFDVAGGNARRSLGKHAGKFRGYWPFNNWEWFLARAHTFPEEVWYEMERRLIEPLGKASQVRITDPEGSHLEFSVTPEEAKRWEIYAMLHGHLIFSTLHATSGEYRQKFLDETLDCPPVFAGVTGVLAGTANHCGFFPRIELYFERDKMVEVKGGGTYGDGIRDLKEKYKNTRWPGYPGKGYFWFCDTALCTSVGAFRRKSDMFNSQWVYPNLPERTRAGVFHLGFGSRTFAGEKEFEDYARKNKLPRGHIHVHNYMATFEVKLRGTNYWYKVVDKGWVSALSDGDLRGIAAKYGLPDEIMKYDWIPPLPGINCRGNYLK